MAEDQEHAEPSGPAPGTEVADEDRFLSTEKEYKFKTKEELKQVVDEIRRPKPKVEPAHVPPFVTPEKPKVDWQPRQKEVDPIAENQEYVAKNMPWVLRIFKRNREAGPQATPSDVLKRQSEAGHKGQPELTTEERRKIQEINFPSRVLSDADRALLKKQGTAGIDGQPELTPEERQRVIEINSRPR